MYVFYVSGRLSGGRVSNGLVKPGGSAKEKPSRVWGGSGVGAELRSEQCLEDSGPGGQIMRNVSRIAAPGGARFRGAKPGWVR